MSMFDISPLWLARSAGALAVAWSVFLVAAGFHPDRSKIVALSSANLLIVATCVPALLQLPSVVPAANVLGWAVLGWLLVWGLVGLFYLGDWTSAQSQGSGQSLGLATEQTTNSHTEK